MFEYKDSYNYGVAVLLALIGVWVDMIVIRYILAVFAGTFLLWPLLHRSFGMTPAVTLMLVCAVGFVGGGAWQLFGERLTKLFTSAPTASTSPSASAPSDDTRWGSLSPSQIATLATRVKSIPPRSAVVACESVNCRDLADDFVTALNSGRWKASPLHSGGIGITGVMGLRIDQDGPAAVALQQAIEDTTGLKVVCIPLPKNIPEPETIYLIVGAKPF